MSINASFSLFKPNPLYRNLRDDVVKTTPTPTIDEAVPVTTTGSHDGSGLIVASADDLDDVIDEGETLLDVDDDLLDQIRELQRRNAELQREKHELQRQRVAESAEHQHALDALRRENAELREQPKMDDEVIELMSQMATEKDQLQSDNDALQKEVDEVYELMEQMHAHVESLELHQHSLTAYVNKVCNDVKTVKRRTVWQKIEFDKERQQLVEELHSWKRRAEELKATEKEAVAAAEATAAWEAACLNQTIEQLRGELLVAKTELDETKEELTRRGGSADEVAETEQMLEALQELALDLKTQVDDANTKLETQKTAAQQEIHELQETVRELKQRAIKQQVAHDKERQELVEELQVWKNRAEESHVVHHETNQNELESTATSSTSTENQTDEKLVVADFDSEAAREKEASGDLETTLPVDVGSPSVSKDNQEDDTASSSLPLAHEAQEPLATDNQRDHDEDSPSLSSTVVVEEDKDTVEESPLLVPQHSDSFFSRLRSFSFRSRADSVSSSTFALDQEPPPTPVPARSRTSSTASSTTSTTSSTTRAPKPKRSSPPVTANTQSDYLRHQEPLRLNSFRNYM